MLISKEDNSGRNTAIAYDVTPSAQAIQEIEDSIFIDPMAKATVRVKVVDGKTQLFGEIDNKLVDWDSDNDIHRLTQSNHDDGIHDYLEVPEDVKSMFPSYPVNRSNLAVVSPELYIVVDNQIYVHFSGDAVKILEYFAIFVRGVNSRYAASSDPSITVKIVGMSLMATTASQPFIENNRYPNGTYNVDQIFSDFLIYKNENINIRIHDLAILITGVNFTVNVNGIAYRGPSCYSTYRIALVRDVNGIFSGVRTLAHELGHNLGSPHDGDVANGMGDCPNSDYFLMSSTGGAGRENSFYFSTCGKRAINGFLGTGNANCYYTDESPSAWTPSPFLPGDKVTMLDVCRDYRPEAYVSDLHTTDELCTNLSCRFTIPCPPPNEHLMCSYSATLNKQAPDGADCDIGKKCSLGLCVM